MIDLKQNTLLREIPNNLLIDKKVERMAKSLQQSLDNMLEWADKINYRMHLDALPDEIIEHLLWESHITVNEGLELATTREQKINLIRHSIELHRLKGTPAALELVFSLLDVDCKLVEWFEYGGTPYHFKLDISVQNRGLTKETYQMLYRLVMEYKNVRSWIEAIVMWSSVKSSIYAGALAITGESHTVYPFVTENADIVDDLYVSANVHHYETAIVYPK